jgi:hypothetical protein
LDAASELAGVPRDRDFHPSAFWNLSFGLVDVLEHNGDRDIAVVSVVKDLRGVCNRRCLAEVLENAPNSMVPKEVVSLEAAE